MLFTKAYILLLDEFTHEAPNGSKTMSIIHKLATAPGFCLKKLLAVSNSQL